MWNPSKSNRADSKPTTSLRSGLRFDLRRTNIPSNRSTSNKAIWPKSSVVCRAERLVADSNEQFSMFRTATRGRIWFEYRRWTIERQSVAGKSGSRWEDTRQWNLNECGTWNRTEASSTRSPNRCWQEFVLKKRKPTNKCVFIVDRAKSNKLVNNVRNSSSDRHSAIKGDKVAEKLVSSDRSFQASMSFSRTDWSSTTISFFIRDFQREKQTKSEDKNQTILFSSIENSRSSFSVVPFFRWPIIKIQIFENRFFSRCVQSCAEIYLFVVLRVKRKVKSEATLLVNEESSLPFEWHPYSNCDETNTLKEKVDSSRLFVALFFCYMLYLWARHLIDRLKIALPVK